MLTKTDTVTRPPHQVWMLYMLESPHHTGQTPQVLTIPKISVFSGSIQKAAAINWTATYRTDSTIVTPYEKWVPYDENVRTMTQNINYAANKTKKVAWFVSNCGAR